MIKLTAKQKKMSDGLTAVQKKLAINLVSGEMSQREAYVAAGGKAIEEKTQDAAASRMIALPEVKAFYDSLIESAASGAVLTKQGALEILSASANVSITDVCDFVEVKGKHVWKIKDFNKIKPEIARCVKSVTILASGPKIELYDSHGAIKQLSDMIGWNVPRKTKISGDEDAPIEHKMIVEFVKAGKIKDEKE